MRIAMRRLFQRQLQDRQVITLGPSHEDVERAESLEARATRLQGPRQLQTMAAQAGPSTDVPGGSNRLVSDLGGTQNLLSQAPRGRPLSEREGILEATRLTFLLPHRGRMGTQTCHRFLRA